MNFCSKTAPVWLIIGKVLYILKIVVPLIIIILAIIEFGKAAIGKTKGSETTKDDFSKAISSLVPRVIAAIVIFFVPTIVNLVFDLVASFSSDIKQDATVCVDCLTDPYNSCDTSHSGGVFR